MKDPYEAKVQFLIKKRESTGLKYLNDSKTFIEYNPNRKRYISIIFDDIIADIHNNEKLNGTVTDFLIRGRKLNISLAFIRQSYFKVPKDVRRNTSIMFIRYLL